MCRAATKLGTMGLRLSEGESYEVRFLFLFSNSLSLSCLRQMNTVGGFLKFYS